MSDSYMQLSGVLEQLQAAMASLARRLEICEQQSDRLRAIIEQHARDASIHVPCMNSPYLSARGYPY